MEQSRAGRIIRHVLGCMIKMFFGLHCLGRMHDLRCKLVGVGGILKIIEGISVKENKIHWGNSNILFSKIYKATGESVALGGP